MATPLAYRVKSLRQTIVEQANRFDVNQLLRLFARAGLPVRIVLDPLAVRRTEDVVAVRLGRGRQPAEVCLAVSAIPPTVRAAGADVVEQYIRWRYAAWVAVHPALSAEGDTPSAETSFARQLRALAAVDMDDVIREYAAFAAGAIRRGGPADLEAACTDYFGVPVTLEAIAANEVRLRVGPLTWAEYREFHPEADGAALAVLLTLAGVFLGPAAAPDVLLVLRADEVPDCWPGTDGAEVGLTCWPHEDGRGRREDVEFLIRNDSLEREGMA